MRNRKQVFEFVYDGMQKGAIGVNLGAKCLAESTTRGYSQGLAGDHPRKG